MAEIKDIIMITIAVGFAIFAGLMIVGFYFTVMSPPGQQFLIGGFEGLASAFYQFVSSPFIALEKMIEGIPKMLGLMIGFAVVSPKRAWERLYLKMQRIRSLFLGRRKWGSV